MPRINPDVERLERHVAILQKTIAAIQADPRDYPVRGCGDSSCIVESSSSRGGQHTNGGCHCEAHKLRAGIMWWKRRAQFLTETIREMRDAKGAKEGSGNG